MSFDSIVETTPLRGSLKVVESQELAPYKNFKASDVKIVDKGVVLYGKRRVLKFDPSTRD